MTRKLAQLEVEGLDKGTRLVPLLAALDDAIELELLSLQVVEAADETLVRAAGSCRKDSFGKISLLNGEMPVHRNPEIAFSIVAALTYASLNSSPIDCIHGNSTGWVSPHP